MIKHRKKDLEAAFSLYRDSWLSGTPLDPDLFCKERPQFGQDLRLKIDDFLYIAGGLSEEDHADASGEAGKDKKSLLGKRLGDFLIIKEIGRGSMGRVYQAEQQSLHRHVALKVLQPQLSLSNDAIRKFRREAEAGARQRHPGIVATFAVGEQDGIHFIAQELVEGGCTLAERLKELREDSSSLLETVYYEELAEVMLTVARALSHAHEKRVIHRDVKPSNILLTLEGAPKVSDFGLAKVEDALSLSRTGDFAGTPYYMSPEQAMSRRIGIDSRTDIFSLGVTLYEALTLVRPFDGETSYEVLKQILFFDPKMPNQVNPRVPRDLAVICIKTLEKKPEDRYASMRDLALDLEAFLQGRTVTARPPSLVKRWVRKTVRTPGLSRALVVGVPLALVLIFLYHMLRPEPALPPLGPDDVAPLTVSLHRGEYADLEGTIGLNVFNALFDDDVRVKAKVDKPAYCALIACNPDGTWEPCSPRDQSHAPRKIENALLYPEDDRYFGLTDGAGLQAFMLIASHEPLPPFEEWQAQLEGLPWEMIEDEHSWGFNGGQVECLGKGLMERGTERSRVSPDAFGATCRFLRSLPGVDVVKGIAFPVKKKKQQAP